MSAASASPATVAGFTVGQQVWFIVHSCVASGIITGFTPWLTDNTKHRAKVDIEDDLKASVFTENMFTGEADATQALLDKSVRQVSYLRLRLRELAKQNTAKARKAAAAAQEGAQ